VPDLLAQQLLLVRERLLPEQAVWVQRLRLLQALRARLLRMFRALSPRHFVEESKSNCSESALQ
jgi:hypothetical protein